MKLDRDEDLTHRIEEFGAWLAENGETLQQHRDTTALPALLQLAQVVKAGVRRLYVEPRLSPELRAALDEMGADGESNVRTDSAG